MLKHHSPAKSGHSIIKKKKKKLCETYALSACGEYTHLLQKTAIFFN